MRASSRQMRYQEHRFLPCVRGSCEEEFLAEYPISSCSTGKRSFNDEAQMVIKSSMLTLISLSSEPDTRYFPSGLKVTART